MENKKTEGRLLFGVLIVLVGGALLASNLGFFSYEIRRYIFRWEMILIAIGAITLINSENRTTGIILMAIGGVFYMRDFFDFHINFWQLFWPGMLILIGILLIFRHRS